MEDGSARIISYFRLEVAPKMSTSIYCFQFYMQKFILYIQIVTPCRENSFQTRSQMIFLLRVMGLNLTKEISYRMTHGCASGMLKWEARYWVEIQLVSYSLINYI